MIVHARLICSDEACAAELVAEGPLAEIEALACECGAGLVVLGIDDVTEPVGLIVERVRAGAVAANVIALPRRRAHGPRRAA